MTGLTAGLFVTPLALLLAVAGCSSDAGSSKLDAASDAHRDGADGASDPAVDPAVDKPVDPPAADSPIPSCDPVAQTCAAGMKCEFDCPPAALSCIAEGSGAGRHGDPCTWPTCGKGTTCITLIGSTVARCLKFCNGDPDCPSGSGCQTLDIGCSGAAPIAIKMCTPLPADAGGADGAGDL